MQNDSDYHVQHQGTRVLGQAPSSAPRHYIACGDMSISELTAQLLLANRQRLVRSRRNKNSLSLMVQEISWTCKIPHKGRGHSDASSAGGSSAHHLHKQEQFPIADLQALP